MTLRSQTTESCDPRESHLQKLRAGIARLAGRPGGPSHALLCLIREYDLSGAWREGFDSCAGWLAWRTGIEPAQARQWVGVAHALARCPDLAELMQRGELRYSELTRQLFAPPTRTRRWIDRLQQRRADPLPLTAVPTLP